MANLLTATQLLELDLYEADICDHLAAGRKPGPVQLVLVLVAGDPDMQRRGEEHVRKVAAVTRYCMSEGITVQHFYDSGNAMLDLRMCFSAARILQQRVDFLAAPGTFGYEVLLAAGFKPLLAKRRRRKRE